MLVVGGSWGLLHRLWISLPVAVGVLVWWLLFLVLVPAAYRSAAEQNG
ncbi:putative conserved membrane protein [Synechococcus sp. PROS-U-1]|nr:putative conserved membrane protein [Synechococcus sp. PROS-U-1]